MSNPSDPLLQTLPLLSLFLFRSISQLLAQSINFLLLCSFHDCCSGRHCRSPVQWYSPIEASKICSQPSSLFPFYVFLLTWPNILSLLTTLIFCSSHSLPCRTWSDVPTTCVQPVTQYLFIPFPQHYDYLCQLLSRAVQMLAIQPSHKHTHTFIQSASLPVSTTLILSLPILRLFWALFSCIQRYTILTSFPSAEGPHRNPSPQPNQLLNSDYFGSSAVHCATSLNVSMPMYFLSNLNHLNHH